MQEKLTSLSKEPWRNAKFLLAQLSTAQLERFLKAHKPPSGEDFPFSGDRDALLEAITSCIRCRSTLRETVHGIACMALLVRMDSLLRRELPVSQMIPSAQERVLSSQQSALPLRRE